MKTNSFLNRIIILAMIVTLTPGCKSYMKLRYGMTEPGEETPEGLIAFLEKNRFPTRDMYMFSDSSSYYQAMRNPLFRKNFLGHMNFDRNGILLLRDTTRCQWSGNDVIRTLSCDSLYKRGEGLNLGQLLDHIRPFGKRTGPDSCLQNPDFTVIVTWAKFLGKYNYRLFELSAAVKENKTARIRTIWLNVDMQKSWHVSKKQKIFIN